MSVLPLHIWIVSSTKSIYNLNDMQFLRSINHSNLFFQVFFDSPLIVNGVCVRWKGYINQEKLDGVGGFRFDEESARVIKIHSYTKWIMVKTLYISGEKLKYAYKNV